MLENHLRIMSGVLIVISILTLLCGLDFEIGDKKYRDPLIIFICSALYAFTPLMW